MNGRFDFDALARDVARGLSRREALRRLGLGLAAGLLAELTGWLPAWPTARAQAATVAPSVSLCFPEIVSKGSLTSWIVVSSTLELAALQAALKPSGCSGCTAEACCNNVCVGLQSDPSNCGRCGSVCPPGESCVNGICVCGGASCSPISSSSTSQKCCGGRCANVLSDANNCGDCGITCPSGQPCCSGQCCPAGTICCGLACVTTLTSPTLGQQTICCGGTGCRGAKPGCCNERCVDLATDVNHCGACANSCRPVSATTRPGCCNSVCTDLLFDAKNCGACGSFCGSDQICGYGVCCAPGQTGGCCCPSGNICRNGLCSPCPPELPDVCNNICVNTKTDSSHCGSCDVFCGSAQICSNGLCCDRGLTNCGGKCTNLQTDTGNCGACGHVCPSGVCRNGACA